ncbi:Gfo/Idh/MocA family protein [Cellulomonas wangsupingiae]|uniref:Gfo/Idh/MocA family oxidoreductase n=1 Tax=Cellulomonas wangsupingiae TaxID=2968085 RepID=A0ABY5K8G4_9CELL|nr:Gfo/Idh/MocA family oxidoreductase [Cellulomonas wangsupingiae]MCC2333038.1 Gfo/Idh/MocA family oxidoreductase [Cellulomonas wangsupingiae]UUI66754.1 Gfo/Idh/MocA family oxidoreductase [Cellulomonas wangsupingiae]
MSGRLRLALVGAGRMGRTHLHALRDHPGVVLTDVVEPVTATHADLAHHGLRVHATLEDLFASRRVDAVLVATPTGTHGDLVRAAVDAGLPVLCEKPAGLTSSDVTHLGRYAHERGVPVQVAYWRRFVPGLVELRDRVEAGDLGEVHLVSCAQWDGAPPSAAFRATSGGIFVDMGVHELDQARWLTGAEIAVVSASAAAGVSDPDVHGDVDSAHATLRLSTGALAAVSLGRYNPGGDVVEASVRGTRGVVHVPVVTPGDGDVPFHRALRAQAQAFADLVGTGTGAGARVSDAAAALAAAEAASAHAGLPSGEPARV